MLKLPPCWFAAAFLYASVASFPALAAEVSDAPLPDAMAEAGVAALREALPAEIANDPEIDLPNVARAVFEQMRRHQWRPIETAPLDEKLLLGLKGPDGFKQALGHWEVHDEAPFDGGRWTTLDWWEANPTHWMRIPPVED